MNPSYTPGWYGTATSVSGTATQSIGQTQTAAAVGTATAQGTPLPNYTQTRSAEQTGTAAFVGTATAQGTPMAGIGTPGAEGTPCPWCLPVPDVPQPLPAPDAMCLRPSTTEWWKITLWGDYEVCRSLSFVSWGSSNTQQSMEISNQFNDHEPFSSIQQIQGEFSKIKDRINLIDTAGGERMASPADASKFTNLGTDSSSPYSGGAIRLQWNAPSPFLANCNTTLANSVGDRLRPGVCFIFDVMRNQGLLYWLTTVVNISTLVGLIFYIKRNWIDTGMQ
jgi:hypothetical protein